MKNTLSVQAFVLLLSVLCLLLVRPALRVWNTQSGVFVLASVLGSKRKLPVSDFASRDHGCQ